MTDFEARTLRSDRTKHLPPRSQMPIHINSNGTFPAGLTLYSKQLHRIADLLDAFAAVEQPDPTNEVAALELVGATLPIYDTDLSEDGGPEGDPQPFGWIHQYDGACWVFVPALWGSDLADLNAAAVAGTESEAAV